MNLLFPSTMTLITSQSVDPSSYHWSYISSRVTLLLQTSRIHLVNVMWVRFKGDYDQQFIFIQMVVDAKNPFPFCTKMNTKIKQPQQEAPRIAPRPPWRSRERIISSGSIL